VLSFIWKCSTQLKIELDDFISV